jgi:uroporphyrinogen decarboxylase
MLDGDWSSDVCSSDLSGAAFRRYVIEPSRELVSRLKKRYPEIPVIGFPREAGVGYASYIRETGVDVMSIDHGYDLLSACNDLQTIKPLQGNLSPDLLVEGGETMHAAVKAILTTLGPRHIFNLGHGVVPQTPPEHVAQLVALVRAHSGIKVRA